ncbi:phospholipase D/nuclease [Eremomyces bilateralis CBS 781.70]|uniref:Phospholipase D/nuclease n=1 Tax=Eremomyces bilateralis CBS 781.70 TaxID=1392243 RepID=A0A6G1FXH4_9PEZI|nr:phospholipase D/nuclease [Eremomyces bilateralis CBS 781.70]KAF1810319.1 phospholipase D/nuclease [Eremomyces bilateralis CBS 781.70]
MTSDDEDEELRRAIALSLQDVHGSPLPSDNMASRDVNKSNVNNNTANGKKESAAMIQYGASQASAPHKRRHSSSTISIESDDAGSKKQKLDLEDRKSSPARPDAPPPFPNVRGLLRKTWVFGQPRDNDIKIEEVLRPSDLRLAVLSAFQWDMEWILNKVKPTTKLVFVMEAKEEEVRKQWRTDADHYKNLVLCFPPMPGQVNRMHSKLMLLSFENWIRVVIPTANLVPYDWGESANPNNRVSGVMENSLFLIDLPRRSDGKLTARKDLTDFGRELLSFCESSTFPPYVIDGLLKFDYTNTKHIQFVHSVGGSHIVGPAETGLFGLSRSVRNLGMEVERRKALFVQPSTAKGSEVHVDYATASLGALNYPFISTFYDALLGREVKQPTKGATSNPIQLLKRVFRIFFPTYDTVATSTKGTDSGGTIFLMSKWWNADTFPKELMRDHVSRRAGILSHSKMILVRHVSVASQGDASSSRGAGSIDPAYLYVGSHNLSESAWGKLVTDRATKKLKINCANWECGVIFRIASPEQKGEELDFALCEGGSLDSIPWELPGRPYENHRPWFCMEDFP